MASSSQSLAQNQQQQLRLSPQQVRFGRLLEMSLPEFEEEISRNLEENPALEIADSPEAVDRLSDGDDFNESADELQRADYGADEDVPSYKLNISNSSPDDGYYEPVAVDNGPDGVASLEVQLADLSLPSDVRSVARYVIGSLDSNGYLTRPAEAIADDYTMATGIDTDLSTVRRAIDAVRSLDPPGVGASDLRDCLLLQLDRMPATPVTEDARRMIRSHFDLFTAHHYDRLRSTLGLSQSRFDEIVALIRSLNPKPASVLESVSDADRMSHIVPDFDITLEPSGAIMASISGNMPELMVAPGFTAADIEELEKNNGRHDREAATFLRERNEAAREFIDMTRRRYLTMSAVIKAIVELQPDFFRTNDRARLRPMVLRDVRDLTGLDLSVISRATAGKYAMTPGGMVSLKSLFSEKVDSSGDLSVAYIESLIRKLVDEEDKHHPLSDEALCEALAEKNVDVARRTVAKYRERMGIPVARLRRI